jgi:hypothetical protein
VGVSTLSIVRVPKCFGSGEAAVAAVEDVSFDVAEGELVSLIGQIHPDAAVAGADCPADPDTGCLTWPVGLAPAVVALRRY